MSRCFVADYPVRFGEIDHAGVMYYPAIFDRIHRCFEDFWVEAVGKTYAQILNDDGIGFPLIDTKTTFRRPFRLGDVARVRVDVERIGRKSVSFRFRLGTPAHEDGHAEAHMVNGVISMADFTPTPLPDAYREALRPFLVEAE